VAMLFAAATFYEATTTSFVTVSVVAADGKRSSPSTSH